MKKAATRVAALIATFIFVAATSVTLTIQMAAPQRPESVIQQCRSNCSTAYNDCRRKANGDGPKKQQCEIQYKRCRAGCEPVASPGE
jgi:hypothetical protein